MSSHPISSTVNDFGKGELETTAVFCPELSLANTSVAASAVSVPSTIII
jgi:hypothetical protein